MTTEALTRAASSAAAITTPEAFTAALARWEQHFNVLTPFQTFSHLAPGWGISGTICQISPDTRPDGPREVYGGLPFLKGNEVALAKKGLRKLAEAGGISTQTYELPTGERFYWKVKAVATYRGIDGTPMQREATKEWDLRDGSPQMRGWKPDQVHEGRKHGLRNCEARAINAAIRECGCGIDQKYTVDQLRKPFLVVRVAFQPDMSDPEVKRLVTQAAMGATSALYGSSAALPAAPRAIADDEDDEPRRVGGSVVDAAAAKPAADPNVPPVEGAVRIAKVDSKSGEKNGRKWTRFLITDSHGVEHSTFDTAIRDAAEKALASKAWVEIIEEQDGQYRNLVEIAPAGRDQRLPMDDEGGY
jgi:hypothetical protein